MSCAVADAGMASSSWQGKAQMKAPWRQLLQARGWAGTRPPRLPRPMRSQTSEAARMCGSYAARAPALPAPDRKSKGPPAKRLSCAARRRKSSAFCLGEYRIGGGRGWEEEGGR